MVKDKDIKQFFRQNKPEVMDSGSFVKDIVRQINAMPVPAAMSPERQKEDCIRIVLEVSRRDMRTVRLAFGIVAVVAILAIVTAFLIPADIIPAELINITP